MKKTMTVLLSVLMILSLTACTNTASSTQQSATGGNAAEENANMDTVENNTEENISSAENEINANADSVESSTDNAVSAENAASVGTQPEEAEKSDVQGAKVLVAYFSATNTTKGVAENLADGLGAELYEIVPETPYTDADLNYNDNNSRTTIEMNDPNARPAISGSVENMEQYEVIFLGYPIWWAQAPKIMCTFMESYDFTGKTIIPFCTSGSSGIGSSATNLEPLTSGVVWLPGRRFSGSASQSTMMEWVRGLGLDLGK